MAFNILDLTFKAQITAVYVGFFGRAPGPDGLDFWIGEYNSAIAGGQTSKQALSNIASSFAIDTEGIAQYPILATPNLATQASAESFINDVFNNLFGHAADAGGLAFWSNEFLTRIASGEFVGTIIVDIISGAQGDDATTIANRITVGEAYADAYVNAGATWTSADDIEGARIVVAGVDATAASVTAAQDLATQIATDDAQGRETPYVTLDLREGHLKVFDAEGNNILLANGLLNVGSDAEARDDGTITSTALETDLDDGIGLLGIATPHVDALA